MYLLKGTRRAEFAPSISALQCAGSTFELSGRETYLYPYIRQRQAGVKCKCLYTVSYIAAPNWGRIYSSLTLCGPWWAALTSSFLSAPFGGALSSVSLRSSLLSRSSLFTCVLRVARILSLVKYFSNSSSHLNLAGVSMHKRVIKAIQDSRAPCVT